MLTDSIKEYIKEHEKEAYDLLLTIARIPSPSNHEEERARFCKEWLEAQGAEGVYIDEALNVVYPADMREEGPIEVYMAHIDVVFADETELPLEIRDGLICCPGVGDDTACLASLLLVAKYIAEHKNTPQWKELRGEHVPGLLLVCNSGEEGLGNLKGVKNICSRYGSRIESFCTFDSSLESMVDRAVGSHRYQVTVRTQGGHSFSNFGRDNAIEKLAGIIERLYQIKVPERGKTTYNVGMISGGTSVNTIAQEAHMLYEFRSEHRENLACMEEQFQEIIKQEQEKGLDVSWELLGLRPCEGEVDPERKKQHSERAARAVEAATGVRPVSGAGSTDCNIPLSLGIPSVCIGCYRGKGAHTREEYVEIDSLKEGYRVAFEMILGRN